MAETSQRDDDQDEWEYEYSATETETFYVDLDLSSVNGVIKSKNAGDRKSLKRARRPINESSADQTNHDTTVPTNDAQGQDGDEDEDADNNNEDGADDDLDNGDANSPIPDPTTVDPEVLDDDYTGRIQILDFNSTNPIVSYNGHIYSCTWHDMIGTTMFVTKHQEAPLHEPEISTEDYDLIGISRIKLVGHRAKTVAKVESKKRDRDESEGVAEDLGPATGMLPRITDGRSLGTITRTNPRTNIEIKQQANFLERLMEIKKSRGETDTVRTFVDRRTVSADARQARKAKVTPGTKRKKEQEETAQQRLKREIHELNKRVVKGDKAALERLQEIYADMEEVEDDEDEMVMGDASAAGPANI